MMFGRVNKKRAQHAPIDEDILLLSRLSEACKTLGVETVDFEYFPEYHQRLGPLPTVYYLTLSKLRFLQSMLPCTVNVQITK